MMYAYIDGDDIGLKIEKSFMDNNEKKLKEVNDEVKKIIDKITNYLIINKLEIIFSGADGIICKGEKLEIKELLIFIRNESKKLTFSIGVGETLCDSFLSLRYAKTNGKNIASFYKNSEFLIID